MSAPLGVWGAGFGHESTGTATPTGATTLGSARPDLRRGPRCPARLLPGGVGESSGRPSSHAGRATTGSKSGRGRAEARPGKCGNGAPGLDGRTTFGLDFVPPTVPKREWTHPPLEGEGNDHLDVTAFRDGLRDHPNREFVECVCEGIANGYDTLIEGDLEGGAQRHPNSSSMTEAQQVHVIREWDAEVKAGRHVRMRHDAHPHLRTQSLGCVDKGTPEPGAEQKCRTVINLSHKWHGGQSNDCGMQDLELKFIKVQHVIEDAGGRPRGRLQHVRHARRASSAEKASRSGTPLRTAPGLRRSRRDRRRLPC